MKIGEIKEDLKSTFGKMVFVKKVTDVFVYDRVFKQRTNELEGRTYCLTSEEHGEIEVFVPATVGELDFKCLDEEERATNKDALKFLEEVEVVKPVLTVYGSSPRESTKVTLNWKCTVETIRRKGNETTLKNTGKV